METLFEFYQRDSSWGDSVELVEIKVFENGELSCNVDIEGRFMTCETKPENKEFAQLIKDLVEKQKSCIEDIPNNLGNVDGVTKSQFVKIGSKTVFGHDWQRNSACGEITEECKKEEQLIKVIGQFLKYIDICFPEIIPWSEIGDNWFDGAPVCSNYNLDEKKYFVCEGDVFTNDDAENVVKVDMLPSSLELYAKCTDAPLFELKVVGVKKISETEALISCEDGCGLEFSFVDEEFYRYSDLYKIGEVGTYQIKADLKWVALPEEYEEGVLLTGDDAKSFFDWIGDGDDVEPGATVNVGCDNMGQYKKMPDFDETGAYEFYGIVHEVSCCSVSGWCGEIYKERKVSFRIPLMEQYKMIDPRYVEAVLKNLGESVSEIEEGWAVKAELRFVAGHGVTNNVYEYGCNREITPEDCGYGDYDDDDYYEDEEGNLCLKNGV